MLVKVILVDDQDRVKLSRKAALAERDLPDEFASKTRPAGSSERPPQGAGGAGGPGGPPPQRRPEGDRGRGGYGGGGDRGGDRGGPRGPR
jgi:polyribonucleotide nucleotidyltransferase